MSTREINITQALTYPFLLKNWINTLLLPGLLLSSLYALPRIDLNNAALNTAVPCCLAILALPIPLGYAWRLIHRLKTSGYDTAASDWTAEKTLRAWLDGLKLIVFIGIIAFVLMLPDSFAGLQSMVPNKQAPIPTTAESVSPHLQSKQLKTTSPDANGMQAASQLHFSDSDIRDIMATADAAERAERKLFTINCIRIAASIVFVPFLLAAIAQSAETRSFRSLCNIKRTLQVGIRGYGKSFLVLLVSVSIIWVWGAWISSIVHQHVIFRDFCLFFFSLVYVVTISFHLLAQSFDSNE